MGTEQQQQTAVTGNVPVAASPTSKHPAIGMVDVMLATGQRDPAKYAALIHQYPDARSEMVEELHKTAGNAFVQQVVAQPEANEADGDKPKAQKGHVLVESEGKWEDLKGHRKKGDSYGGFSKYGGGKVRDKLVELVNAGQLVLTGTQIAVFDAVSQVETGGQIGCVQTYDDQVVSVGFKQVVLGHGSLEKMMVKAPAGFAKHGLSLDTSKTYKKSGWSKQPHQIVGCPDVEALRTPEWAIKFYHASMEPDVIAAMCELLAHEQAIVDKSIDREGGVNENYFDDATAKSWLLECYNNRPAFTEKAIERAGAKAAKSREEFLDALSDAIIETYVVEEPKLHFKKAKKAAEKKGKKLTPEQETQLLADMKKKYEPIGRKKGTNIVTKIGRKVTPAKLNATSTAAPTNAPAPTTTAATTTATAAPVTAAPITTDQADVHVETDEADVIEIDTAAPAAETAATTAPETPAPAATSQPATEVADSRTAPVVEAAATHAPQPFRVTAKGLNIRAGAGTDHEVIGGLKRGDMIDVIGREGKWLMITHDGQTAYVHHHYVEPAESKTEASDAPQLKPRVASDAAGHATKPPKKTAPAQGDDETPWWYDEETKAGPAQSEPKADPKAIAQATGETAVAIGHGAMEVLDAINPMGWFSGDDETAQPSSTTPAPTTTAKPTKSADTKSPIGALTPADLHNETLERMVATMNNPLVTAIAGELAGLQATSAQLKKKANRKEEQGTGRDDLVEGIRALRGKVDQLTTEPLDKQQVKAFKAAVYRQIADIAPYYFQSRNVDILETVDNTRTCNMTVLGMALEGIGRNPNDYTGDKEPVKAAARLYQHRLVKGEADLHGAVDATAGQGVAWENLIGMRFPDFLQLVAIAQATKGDLSDAGVKAAQAEAYKNVTVWKNILEMGGMFKTSATQKLFDPTGTRETKENRKKGIKHDYKVLKAHGNENRSPVEAFINQRNKAEASGKQKDKDKLEKLRPAYEAAIADPGTDSGLDQRATLDVYRDHITEHVGADLDAGGSVIVGLSGHFVRLQSLHDDHVLVNDPARDTRSLTKLSWAEARAMGYFAVRFVIR